MTGDAPLLQARDGDDQLASITAAHHDHALVISIAGEIDISNVDRVAQLIDAQPNVDEGMVIDISQVGYLDSSAVSLLHNLAVRLRGRAQRLVVVSPTGTPPRRVLELTALETNAPVVDSLEPAVKLLRNSALP